MPKNLNVILGNMGVQGSDRIRGGSASIDFQSASNVGVDPEYTDKMNQMQNFSQGMQSLGNIMGDWLQKKEVKQKKTGEDNANYLLQHHTPEELGELRKTGKMPFQDDPYAMKALRMKIGQTISMDVDGGLMSDIKNGKFNDRQSLDIERAKRFNEQAKQQADAYGVDFTSDDVQSGLNSQVTERNISLYSAHDEYMDGFHKNQAELQHKTDADALYGDPKILQRADAPDIVFGNMDNQRRLAAWNPEAIQQNVIQDVSNISNRVGGLEFLLAAEKKTVLFNGQRVSPKSFFSEDQWQNMKAKASTVKMTNDAAVSEKFQTGLSSVQFNPDINSAEAQLAQIKDEYNKLVPTNQMTPQRQQIIDTEQALIARRAQSTQEEGKKQLKLTQDSNKMMVIDSQFNKRLNGQYVPTDYKNLPSNEATGEFGYDDMVNYANKKLTQIDAMPNLSDDQKADAKLKYLRADSEGGAFRSIMGTLVSDAQKEWTGAVINGRPPQDGGAMDKLRGVRDKDPSLFAQLYPEQADLFLTMDMTGAMGIDKQVLLDADRAKQSVSKEMRFQLDKDWMDSKNDSKFPDMARIPSSLDGASRKIYDSVVMRTGNQDMARQLTSRFVQENTVTFKDENVDGESVGTVPRSMLTVNSDPASYQQGQKILDDARTGLLKANPWVNAKSLSVYAQGNNIYLMDTTGTVKVRYDQDTLKRVWQDEQEKAMTKAQDETIKKANERAPISRVPQVREAAKKRVEAKKAKTPKFIYGGSVFDE